jgi:hypothetical protein
MDKISVIVATCNRSKSLKATLASLLSQKYFGFDCEVIVVDNNSQDTTKETVESYGEAFKGRLRYLFERRKGKSFALNKAIEESRGQIIVFTDDDCVPKDDWLERIWQHFNNNDKPDIILGNAVFEDGQPFFMNNRVLRGNGLNMSFRRKLIEELGNFDTYLGPGSIGCSGEDTDFVYRAQRKNKNIIVNNEILVIHKLRESVERKYKYAYRDSKAFVIFWLKYILKNNDIYALRNLYLFFKDTILKIIKETGNQNKERIVLKSTQFAGAIVGLMKGSIIWLVIEPVDKLCRK